MIYKKRFASFCFPQKIKLFTSKLEQSYINFSCISFPVLKVNNKKRNLILTYAWAKNVLRFFDKRPTANGSGVHQRKRNQPFINLLSWPTLFKTFLRVIECLKSRDKSDPQVYLFHTVLYSGTLKLHSYHLISFYGLVFSFHCNTKQRKYIIKVKLYCFEFPNEEHSP